MLVFELSKALMFEFNHDYIKINNSSNKSNNSRLLFTGTDSLMYETKTEDVSKNFRQR